MSLGDIPTYFGHESSQSSPPGCSDVLVTREQMVPRLLLPIGWYSWLCRRVPAGFVLGLAGKATSDMNEPACARVDEGRRAAVVTVLNVWECSSVPRECAASGAERDPTAPGGERPPIPHRVVPMDPVFGRSLESLPGGATNVGECSSDPRACGASRRLTINVCPSTFDRVTIKSLEVSDRAGGPEDLPVDEGGLPARVVVLSGLREEGRRATAPGKERDPAAPGGDRPPIGEAH
mmetsp:Transcript_20278/g.47077  ORF Transcript_20278/g.47077 Transcript_20278/m.47077 type:complete len:235 (+) Transcript_20278:613-1317(+)